MKSKPTVIRETFPSHTAVTERDCLFPREQHPDNRTAQQFFRDMAFKQFMKSKKPKQKVRDFFTISKPVVCITTGETFVSVTAAANAHGINKGQLSKHLNGHFTDMYGMVFKFQDQL